MIIAIAKQARNGEPKIARQKNKFNKCVKYFFHSIETLYYNHQ
jgi:hypothetical protein